MPQSENFVVFTQTIEEPSRISEIFGPFRKYHQAADFCRKLRKETNDNKLWIGIRILSKPTRS